MFKRCTILLSTLVLVLSLGVKAQANTIDTSHGTTLAHLIETQGHIDEGDKRFSDFTFQIESSDLRKTSPDNAGGILVDGITSHGNYGLSFVPSGYDHLFYAGQGAQLRLVIGYKVSVLDLTEAISDIHLSMGSFTEGNASITVTEKVYQDMARTILLGQAQVTNPPEYFDSDMVNLDHLLQTAYVTKEILIDGGTGCDFNSRTFGCDCNSSGKITYIKQLVSQERIPQEVPEPSTILLLGSGLIGFIARIRARNQERA